VLIALLAGFIAIYAAMKVTGLVQPPGANSVTDTLNAVSADPFQGSIDLVKKGWENFKTFAYPGYLDPTAPTEGTRAHLDMFDAQAWGYLVMLLAAVGSFFVPRLGLSRREAFFHTWNLVLLIVASVTLYLPFGYYRILGAHVLLSVLVLVAFRRFAIVAVVLALNLIMVGSFLNAYGRWSPNFSLNQAGLAAERATIAKYMKYDPHARSPWCNTIALPTEIYDGRVTLIPPGFGVADVLVPPIVNPPRSEYVLLTADATNLAQGIDRSRLQELVALPDGTLYRNPDSECRARRTAQ
jgi:hypothetical protein